MKVEFLILPLQTSVKPEDYSSDEGQALLSFLKSKASSYAGLKWGRSVERPEEITVAFEHNSSSPGITLSEFSAFQSSSPSLFSLDLKDTSVLESPITEIAKLPLSESLTPDEATAGAQEISLFGATLLESPAPSPYKGKAALAFQHGWAGGQQSNTDVILLGWRDIANHTACLEAEQFKGMLAPVLDRLVGAPEVFHVVFQSI